MACQLIELIAVFTCKSGTCCPWVQAAAPWDCPTEVEKSFNRLFFFSLICLPMAETLFLILGIKTLNMPANGYLESEGWWKAREMLGCHWGGCRELTVLGLLLCSVDSAINLTSHRSFFTAGVGRKSQWVNMLGFATHTVSVATAQLCHFRARQP